MELYSSAFGNHPTPPKVSGLGVMVATQQEVKNLACRKSVRVAGSRPQGPVGQVSRGLGAGPQGLGPGPPGAWGLFPPKPLKLRFFRKPPGGSLAKAWVSAETAASEVGTWRETKPGYPPYPPPLPPHPHPAFWGCKGERKRVFTLSAFGNHPTRPPRSADPNMNHNPKP